MYKTTFIMFIVYIITMVILFFQIDITQKTNRLNLSIDSCKFGYMLSVVDLSEKHNLKIERRWLNERLTNCQNEIEDLYENK